MHAGVGPLVGGGHGEREGYEEWLYGVRLGWLCG